jgi:hypothetical protein
MKNLGTRLLMAAGLVGLAAGSFSSVGCGGGGSGGTAGTSGTTGSAGHAGTTGTGTGGGGATGTAGHAGTSGGGTTGEGGGGASGTGGATAGAAGTSAAGHGGTGGAAGAAGAAGGAAGHTDGGTAGTGGSPSDGGAGTDGGTTTAALYYTFDSSNQGWAIGTSGSGNIAAIEGGAPASVNFDSAVGNPNPGSLVATGTFTAYNQVLQAGSGIISPAIDLTGKTVHVWVRLDAGDAGTGFTGGVQVQFLSTPGSYVFGQNNNTFVTLTAGTWTEITADMAAVHTMYPNFDPSQVIEIQVQFATGSGPEGGTFTTTTPTFHIDTITDGSGGSAPPPVNFTFNSTLEGFALTTNIPQADGGPAPAALTFDSTVGDPSPGSAKVVATFTDYNQKFDIQANIGPAANLTGKVVHAKVMLDNTATDGGTSSLPSGFVQIHTSSTGYVYGQGNSGSLTAGSWVDITMDPANPNFASTGYDKTQIIQAGIQVGIGGGPEGGTFPGPLTLTFHFDSIVAQ